MMTDIPSPFPNVRLVLLADAAMRTMLKGDLDRASELAGLSLPLEFLEEGRLWRYRVDQIGRDPESQPWLVRAVVAVPEDVVVGHTGFHGPPDARGMVEIGYTILPRFRKRGYARAAVRELFRYAGEDARVQFVRASIRPDNVASLSVVRAFKFEQVGDQWDEEDGLELVLERPVRLEEAER